MEAMCSSILVPWVMLAFISDNTKSFLLRTVFTHITDSTGHKHLGMRPSNKYPVTFGMVGTIRKAHGSVSIHPTTHPGCASKRVKDEDFNSSIS